MVLLVVFVVTQSVIELNELKKKMRKEIYNTQRTAAYNVLVLCCCGFDGVIRDKQTTTNTTTTTPNACFFFRFHFIKSQLLCCLPPFSRFSFRLDVVVFVFFCVIFVVVFVVVVGYFFFLFIYVNSPVMH